MLKWRVLVLSLLLAGSSTLVHAGDVRRGDDRIAPGERSFIAPSDPATFHGRASIKSFDDHRIAVGVTVAGESVDHVFRFWSEESLPALDAAFFAAEVRFYGDELVVVAPEERSVIRFSVGRGRSHGPSVPEGFSATSFAGYGLNHEMRASAARGGISAQSNCEPDCGEPIFEWPGDGASDCNSGGTGATSCSVSQSGSSCSVSCDLGFYACCKIGFGGVSCSCVRK